MKDDLQYWEYDPKTKVLKSADVMIGSVFCSFSREHGPQTTTTSYIKKREGMIYFQALNERNAIRKSKKL
jgi:hypothetical protein